MLVEIGELASLHGSDFGLRHAGPADHLVVDDPDTALADRPHGQFRLERHPQLAHHDHVQRRAKRPSHLEGNRDPAPGQAEHDDVAPTQIIQAPAKALPGVGPVGETHLSPPVVLLARHVPWPVVGPVWAAREVQTGLHTHD